MRTTVLLTLTLTNVVWLVGIASTQEPGDRGRREGPRGPGGFMRAIPVMAVLDADEDGDVSAAEIANAVAALKGLDDDKNGKLTEEELRPEFGVGRGGFGGPGGPGGPGGFGRGGLGGPGAGPGGFGGFGPPNSDQFVARALEFDEDKDGKLSRDELVKMAEQFGRGFGGRGFGGRDEGSRVRPQRPASDE